MGCSWFNTETNKKKKSLVMRPNLQPKIYKSPFVAQQLLISLRLGFRRIFLSVEQTETNPNLNEIKQLYHMYATTRYNFVRLKATHKISPLEELVGGDLPPNSSQRLTGMGQIHVSSLKLYTTSTNLSQLLNKTT